MVTDISDGGAGLHYPEEAPGADCAARLNIEEFGTYEGFTLRSGTDRCGIQFVQGEAERNNLPIKLTLYVEDGLADASQHGRWPTEPRLSLMRTTGIQEKCDVLCISLQGLTLATEQRPPLGELVRLGRMYGRVVEHLQNGIAIRFLSFVNPAHDLSEATPTPQV